MPSPKKREGATAAGPLVHYPTTSTAMEHIRKASSMCCCANCNLTWLGLGMKVVDTNTPIQPLSKTTAHNSRIPKANPSREKRNNRTPLSNEIDSLIRRLRTSGHPLREPPYTECGKFEQATCSSLESSAAGTSGYRKSQVSISTASSLTSEGLKSQVKSSPKGLGGRTSGYRKL